MKFLASLYRSPQTRTGLILLTFVVLVALAAPLIFHCFIAHVALGYYWAMWTKLPREEMLLLVNRQSGEQELPDTGVHH